jgi:hypothetical protein
LVVVVATAALETMAVAARIYVSDNCSVDDDSYCCGNDGVYTPSIVSDFLFISSVYWPEIL